ncbi:Histone-Lysine N-Methyltransferase ash1l [Geranomyces michiganensis]|nr:Histone-Lysine N-Methyltransferase ash1l [Geranomyces michiganensis]
MILPELLQQWINEAASVAIPNPKRRKRASSPPPPPPGKYAKDAEARWAGPPLLQELYARKSYLSAGLYSSVYKTSEKYISSLTAQTGSCGPLLPLPMYYGNTLMTTEEDFSLPYDLRIFKQAARGVAAVPTAATKPPSAFIKIQKNIFVDRRPNKCKEIAICHCEKPEDPNAWACTENCLNRCMMIECNPDECPAGDRCANQRFRNKEHVKDIEVVWTAGRGYGLQATSAIRASTLVLEYRGEIISQETCLDRMRDQYADLENHYFLNYSRGEVIDGCRKGTDARFVNHSCEPNCHIEKWMVDGEYAVGLFAKKDIAPGDELTYDYRFESFGPMKPCLCGAPTCRGFIGLNKKVEIPKPAPVKTGQNRRKAHIPRRKRVPSSSSNSPSSSPPMFSLLPPAPPALKLGEAEASQPNRMPAISKLTKKIAFVEERKNVWLRHRADIVARAYKLLLKQRRIYSSLRVFQVRCALAGARSLLPVLGLDSGASLTESSADGARDVGTPRKRQPENAGAVRPASAAGMSRPPRRGLDAVVANLWLSKFGHPPPEDDEPRRPTRSSRSTKSGKKSGVTDALITHFERLNQTSEPGDHPSEIARVLEPCLAISATNGVTLVDDVVEEFLAPVQQSTPVDASDGISDRPALRRSARRSQGGVDVTSNNENARPIMEGKKTTLAGRGSLKKGAKMTVSMLTRSGQLPSETVLHERRPKIVQ